MGKEAGVASAIDYRRDMPGATGLVAELLFSRGFLDFCAAEVSA